MPTVSVQRLADVFVEVADTLVDDFDLVEFLQMVTTRTAELTAASAAGLLLADNHDRLQFMAASDESSRLLELYQVQVHEGPCQDCFVSREPVVNADLTRAGHRWPVFAPQAVERGYRSVHAFPLRWRSTVIGALNMFGEETGQLAPADVHLVQSLADVATIGLLQERAIHEGEVLNEQLTGALESRVLIEQAKGAVAQLQGVSVDDAFLLIRTHARNRGLPLREVAQRAVRDPGAIEVAVRS